jgi:hypothetical protein
MKSGQEARGGRGRIAPAVTSGGCRERTGLGVDAGSGAHLTHLPLHEELNIRVARPSIRRGAAFVKPKLIERAARAPSVGHGFVRRGHAREASRPRLPARPARGAGRPTSTSRRRASSTSRRGSPESEPSAGRVWKQGPTTSWQPSWPAPTVMNATPPKFYRAKKNCSGRALPGLRSGQSLPSVVGTLRKRELTTTTP